MFALVADQIARLHLPVGLHIGAQTPPEVAVAIIAEMTAIRRDVPVLQSRAKRRAARRVRDSA
ncbi:MULTISPECIES: XdhC family protein [Burkholderia cepacia complex]|uniref:XdhC family protein n=1 Tax=Burkholderia cepacia complex TaxID=87882 RepID=UPI000A4E77BB|nr:XdhC family protein [Burkholderia pseudomultivorans]